MMKKVIFILSFIIGCLIIFSLNTSKAAISGNYTYEVKSDGTVKITDYNTSAVVTNLNIPSTIDGKKVTEIGASAFENVQAENVTIPNTVNTLQGATFRYSKIKSITIPSSVVDMKYSTLFGSTVETANIQANITELPNATFTYCSNLKKVTLGSAIKTLDVQTFLNCTSLTDFSFLNTIENIEDWCFMGCTGIKEIVLPANIKTVGRDIFDDTVKVDMSKTRLMQFGEYYAVGNKITVEGTFDYNKAFEVLNLVNEQRKANGLSGLKMDEQLLEDAMVRAAEQIITFGHDRPTGLTCFSINNNMGGENAAAGVNTPQSVMSMWMNSSGHRANILTSSYKSIGIGCFTYNGISYWIQCFGRSLEKEATKKGNYTGEKEIYVGDNYISLSLSTNYQRLKPNGSYNAEVKNRNLRCNPSCATWKSSNTEVATVDKNGKITGLKNGTAEITATLGLDTKKITVFVQQFDDINKADWYVDSVNYCYNKGIILGTGTKYNPSTKLTRGMLVTILHRMDGKPSPTTQNKFSDVSKSQYYYDAVVWATEKGIVHGYNNGKFGPDDNITRQDLAVILRNFAQYKGKNVNVTANLNKFSDGNIVSDYAKTAMQWAVGKGVLTGNNNGESLTPHSNSTRAEAAGMIYNYCTKVNV